MLTHFGSALAKGPRNLGLVATSGDASAPHGVQSAQSRPLRKGPRAAREKAWLARNVLRGSIRADAPDKLPVCPEGGKSVDSATQNRHLRGRSLQTVAAWSAPPSASAPCPPAISCASKFVQIPLTGLRHLGASPEQEPPGLDMHSGPTPVPRGETLPKENHSLRTYRRSLSIPSNKTGRIQIRLQEANDGQAADRDP